MATTQIPELFIATKASTTTSTVLGSVSAAVEAGLNRMGAQMPEIFLAAEGDLSELAFIIHEAQNRGRLKESARAYRVNVKVEIEELGKA